MTPALDALKWLVERNGDGGFCVARKGGPLLAAGDIAPFMRSTWNKLRDAGLVEYYGGKSGQARCRVTLAGRSDVE